MNERIKKLKEQATSYTWNGNDVTEELDEQKFAELIVRECANLFVTMEGREFSEFDKFDAANHVKKHFGVE